MGLIKGSLLFWSFALSVSSAWAITGTASTIPNCAVKAVLRHERQVQRDQEFVRRREERVVLCQWATGRMRDPKKLSSSEVVQFQRAVSAFHEFGWNEHAKEAQERIDRDSPKDRLPPVSHEDLALIRERIVINNQVKRDLSNLSDDVRNLVLSKFFVEIARDPGNTRFKEHYGFTKKVTVYKIRFTVNGTAFRIVWQYENGKAVLVAIGPHENLGRELNHRLGTA